MSNENRKNLYIFSGNCNMGLVGDPVSGCDESGIPLHVGDIIQLWCGHYIGTELEEWVPIKGLTAVVSEGFVSYSDGTVELSGAGKEFFCMGIKNSGFDCSYWKVSIVKSHKDVIEGESWSNYGFNYRTSEAADLLLNEREK